MSNIENFNQILENLKVNAKCVNINSVDNYSSFDIKLSYNAKVKDIQKYSDEIALALKMPNKPTCKILHEKGIIRLEFFSNKKDNINLFDLFSNKDIPKFNIPILLGKDIYSNKMWIDLAEAPHILIAGTTGSGKSTLLHNIIANLINYNNVSLFLIDPKNIEFSLYGSKIRNVDIATTYRDALVSLDNLISIMNHRYYLMRNDHNCNFPPIVIIIDEFSDLILQDEDKLFYNKLCKLAQKCRAANIHIILSTQRPSVNIIDGAIKANFPTRVACKVSTHVDSKVILDATGAENLLGKGDSLIKTSSNNLERFQIAYTNAKEVCNLLGAND